MASHPPKSAPESGNGRIRQPQSGDLPATLRNEPPEAAPPLDTSGGASAANPLRTVALLGNHLPRQCGIATFTTDLRHAIATGHPGLDCFVVAINEPGKRWEYPESVRFEIAEADATAYRRAADFLNINNVDAVCVQHEYGIFGGKAGGHVLTLLRALRMPVVTTLHTILRAPNPQQRIVMDEIAQLSERLVVMSAHGAALLREIYQVPGHKIDLIPHGIPDVISSNLSKDRLGVSGNAVILSFGLLSPDKGIEYVIEAMPAILERHPNTVYIVLGATHPHVKAQHGETYRLMLENRAERLGIGPHMIFHDRFVSQAELVEFLGAADIYITPYLSREQITSGTLAYAVGSGKAVISTPYSYAEELLAGGRGVLVPWRDAKAISQEVVGILDDPAKREAMCERAASHGRAMRWPVVARSYVESLDRARADHTRRQRTAFRAKTLAERQVDLPEISFDHLLLMTDQTGMLQHSLFSVPRYSEGYCLDDNARALLLMTLIEESGTEDRNIVLPLASRYLAFVSSAFDEGSQRFRNLMSYSRQWLEDHGSEDSHGRALWALGTIVGRSGHAGRQNLSHQLFQAALPVVLGFTSPRSWAYALLGIAEYLRSYQGDKNIQAVQIALAKRLHELYQRSSRPDWPWFEERATYCNARLSQALIVSGGVLHSPGMLGDGLKSLEWLAQVQTGLDGYFGPIGSNGFYGFGEPKAQFDQQPVEACGMISACLAAFQATRDERWRNEARRAFDWFLGQNALQQPLYDATTGGCHDGLHGDRVNENQGAEATLSFLLGLVEMRAATVTDAALLADRGLE